MAARPTGEAREERRALVRRHGVGALHAMTLGEMMRLTGLWRQPARDLQLYVEGLADGEAGIGPPESVEAPPDTLPAMHPPPDGEAPGIRHTTEGIDVIGTATRIRTLDDLLADAEVDPAEWVVDRWRANAWETVMRDGEGDPVVVPVRQVRATLVRRIPAIEPDRLPPAIPREPPPQAGPVEVTLVIPDSQHGYRWRDRHRYLDPMHDRVALDCALQAAKLLRPTTIVLLGDMLDLAPWSTRWTSAPDVVDTTRPALAELQWQIAELRRVAPSARIVYVEGNHENRVQRALLERLPEAATLDDPPSIPRLLSLDRWDVEYVGPYGSRVWLYDDVRVIHGDAHGRSSAARHMEQAATTTIYGHVHRIEVVPRRYETPTGSRMAYSISPGCMCRVDGAVPGVSPRPDWHQGIAVLTREVATGALGAHAYPIEQGRLVLPHVTLVGRDRSEEIAEAVGWGQLVRRRAA